MTPMRIGILSLQGAVEPHITKLSELGATPVEVRRHSDLERIEGIILPGGESTTMLYLLGINELWDGLKDFVTRKPSWGVCAGAILLSKEVSSPKQEFLAAMDIAIERNAYGRQIDSFIAPLDPTPDWIDADAVEGVFIRAPKINGVYGSSRVLMRYLGEPVMVEEHQLLVTTFHPELTCSYKIHQYFLKKCGKNYGPLS